MEKHCQEMYQKTLLSIFIEGVLSEKSPLNVRKQLLEEDLVNCIDNLLVEKDHVRASYEILIPATSSQIAAKSIICIIFTSCK